MQQTFVVTFEQMLVLFAFMVIGFILARSKAVPDTASAAISKMEVTTFLPAMVFQTFSQNLTRSMVAEKAVILVVSAISLVVVYGLARVLSGLFSKEPATRAVYTYGLCIPNLGYIGYPLVQAVFGDAMLLDMMVFALPYVLFCYTVGMTILNPSYKLSWKALLTPTNGAILLGIVVGLCEIPLPGVVTTLASKASACMAPLGMIMTGFVLARSPLRDAFTNGRMALASLLRMIGMAAVMGLILYALNLRGPVLTVAVAAMAMPMGINNVIFPEAYGGDSRTGAQSCCISNVLGMVTLPLVFAVLSLL